MLVRADLEEAGAEVTRRGYPWGMVTNGMALTPERFGCLLDAGLKSVSVSLDGFEPVSYTHLDVYKRQGRGPSRQRFRRSLQTLL